MIDQNFSLDGLWVQNSIEYLRSLWKNNIKYSKGIILGIDKNQEWMLNWWWENYKKYNDYPVLFVDFGMTQEGAGWCKQRGDFAVVEDFPGCTKNWFKKPLACLESIFETAIWLDTDCEVRGNLEPIFKYTEKRKVAATIDRGTPQMWYDILPENIIVYNSGIVAFKHGELAIHKWGLMTLLMTKLTPEVDKIWLPTGDQEILALSLRQYAKDRVSPLPVDLVRLRIEPDGKIYENCLIKHWTGPVGKEEIRKQFSHVGRMEFIAEQAKIMNWKKGAELGVKDGRTLFYVLENCLDLHMIGVDKWAAQPNSDGPEKYLPGENGFSWNFGEYEKTVRDRAKNFENRLTILKDWTHNAVKKVEDNTLDFIFIDADHSYESVKRDILEWAPKIKETGWIIGHDIDWETVRKAVDELCPGYVIGPDNIWYLPKINYN